MRRPLLVPVAVLSALLVGSTAYAVAGEPDDVSLRVATYNIQAGIGMDDVFDVERTAEAIADLDAEVVALQEVDVHWDERSQWRDVAGELAESLDMHVHFGEIYSLEPDDPSDPQREFGNALLSQHPFTHSKNHEITRMSSQDPDPVPELMPGFPEVAVDVDGHVVHVYSTHLDYREDPEVRQMQVADMRGVMEGPGDSAQILMGDLNARPGAPELDPLWEDLDDAWESVHGPEGGFTYPADVPDRRIDYIGVTSGVEVVSAEVAETLASDHLPVVAEVIVG